VASHFGTKVGVRVEHVIHNPTSRNIWPINHSLERKGERQPSSIMLKQMARSSSKLMSFFDGAKYIQNVGLLRLILSDLQSKRVLSRNV
jgi:hypothetical protein